MSFGPGPDLTVLDAWWGTTTFSSTFGLAAVSQALNLGPCGGNPLYQVSDFLSCYPKFGTGIQGLTAVSPGSSAGSGYAVNDVLAVVQPDASGGTVKVTAVSGGVPTAYAVVTQGTGYSVASGLATTGGTGTGATVNVTNITPTSVVVVPQLVLQLYINFASSCLSSSRWGTAWQLAMNLFVAHYVTLFMQTEGNPGSTPGAIAASGIAGGIVVAQAAGDVSQSYEAPPGFEDAGSWSLTTYGQSLFTMSKVVGMGMVYAW